MAVVTGLRYTDLKQVKQDLKNDNVNKRGQKHPQ